MFDCLKRLFWTRHKEEMGTSDQTEAQQLYAQVDRLIKLNNLTENELREQRDGLAKRESELIEQWRRESDEDRKRDRLIDIKYIRDDKDRIEKRLSMLYDRGKGLRATRATLQDVQAAKIPSLEPEQLDQIRAVAEEAMSELREVQIAFSQLEGSTSFASSLDSDLKRLEAELKGSVEVKEPSKPTPIETPNYAERELDELKRELEEEEEA